MIKNDTILCSLLPPPKPSFPRWIHIVSTSLRRKAGSLPTAREYFSATASASASPNSGFTCTSTTFCVATPRVSCMKFKSEKSCLRFSFGS